MRHIHTFPITFAQLDRRFSSQHLLSLRRGRHLAQNGHGPISSNDLLEFPNLREQQSIGGDVIVEGGS